jgi:hypothetical protein
MNYKDFINLDEVEINLLNLKAIYLVICVLDGFYKMVQDDSRSD